MHVYDRVTASGLDTETVQTANGPFTDFSAGTASFLQSVVSGNISAYKSDKYFPDGTGGPINDTTGNSSDAIHYPFDFTGTLTSALRGFAVTTTSSDIDEVNQVAADPYGIGYASVGDADPTKVTIVPLNINGVIQKYDRSNVENTTATDAGNYVIGTGPAGHRRQPVGAHPPSLWHLQFLPLAESTPGDPDAAQEFLELSCRARHSRSPLIFNALFFKP